MGYFGGRMTKQKYSIQFERFDNDPTNLLCNAITISDVFCSHFPVSNEVGYVGYKELEGTPKQEFWFSVQKAGSIQEAFKLAILSLIKSNKLEKPFPATLNFVTDEGLNL
jgi:hypothetical protein